MAKTGYRNKHQGKSKRSNGCSNAITHLPEHTHCQEVANCDKVMELLSMYDQALEMHNQTIEMNKQTMEMAKQGSFAKRAFIIALISLFISLLAIVAPIVYQYLVNDRIEVPSFSLLLGSALADELSNISIDDSDSDVMRSTFTVFEANGCLDCYTNNSHVFYVTNNNNIAIAVSDVYFRVKEYYPITNFFQLYIIEGWGDVKHNIYRFDIGTGSRREYHGVKCDSNRLPLNDTFTRIEANSIEAFKIEYNFSAQGVYYGDLVFVFEINNQSYEKVFENSTYEATSTSKIVYLPESYNFDQNAGPKFLEFNDSGDGVAHERDGYMYINDTFSCVDHIKQHLIKYYSNYDAYYQCVLDYYVPFFRNTYFYWDIELNKELEW